MNLVSVGGDIVQPIIVCLRWTKESHGLLWLQVPSPPSQRNKTNTFVSSSGRSRDHCGKLSCRLDWNILFADLACN